MTSIDPILFIGIVFVLGVHTLFVLGYSGRFQFAKVISAIVVGVVTGALLTFVAGYDHLILTSFVSANLFLIAIYLLKMQWRKIQLDRQVIIPEYNLDTDLKLYEIGALIDGSVTTKDLIAHFLDRKINSHTQMDDTEIKLENVFNQAGGFNKFLETLSNQTSSASRIGNSFGYSYTYTDYSPKARDIVYTQMQQDGYFYFNPVKWQNSLSLWSVMFIFLAPTFLADATNELITTVALVVGYWLLAIAPFCNFLTERINNTIPKLNKIRGHKMYLATAEKYRLTKDPEVFKKYIPYFISYQIREDLAKEGIERFGLLS